MYELYCKFRDKKGYKDSDVSKATGIPASTFSDWKRGRSKPNTEKLAKIADYLDTMVEYLDCPKGTLVMCPDCGMTYVSTEKKEIRQHEKIHSAWQDAERTFGALYANYPIREKIKARNRNIRDDRNNTIDERYNAELEVLRCLFSRSVEASGYNLQHVNFGEYVAMMMYGKEYRKNLDDELYQKIVDNFGTKPGIKDGESIYRIPKKSVELNEKDNRDISKDIDSIMNKLELKEYGPAAYDGEDLSEESVALFKEELEFALRRLKLINKEKYNPNKNKK